MTKQPYVFVDWRKIDTVREAIQKGSSITLCALSAHDARHRKTLMELSVVERKRLVGLDVKLAGEVAIAAALLCDEEKLADGIGLFDLVAASRHSAKKVEMTAGVNATYYLLEGAPAELKTRERARKYVDYFAPVASINTAILLNIAELQRDVLGEGKAAIETLREAIELGDPRVRSQIAGEADKWRSLPGYKALAAVTPKIPTGLRCLQTWNDLRGDEVTALSNAGLDYFDLDFSGRLIKGKLSQTFYGVDDADFEVFAASDELATWALWRRDPKAPRDACPVVVFGGEGSIGVYADSVAAMLCLFAHGWRAGDVEAIGYLYGDDTWTPPKKLRALKPNKSMVAKLKEVAPDAMKRDPDRARKNALALMPELVVASTRRSKKSAVRTSGTPRPKLEAKKKVKDSPFEVGFAKIPEAQWPADLKFLQSKKGKTWLDTWDARILKSQGDLPELLQDLDREDEDSETLANQRAIREVLGMVTFAVEAPNDNAKLYGYWRGPEKTPLKASPIVGFDSEGTISREIGASLLDVLLQESCYSEAELFAERKAALEKAGQKIATKRWDDYTSRGKWKTDPEKLHEKLYKKYRKQRSS